VTNRLLSHRRGAIVRERGRELAASLSGGQQKLASPEIGDLYLGRAA